MREVFYCPPDVLEAQDQAAVDLHWVIYEAMQDREKQKSAKMRKTPSR